MEPLMSDGNIKNTQHSIHTTVVNNNFKAVLNDLPRTPIANNESSLHRIHAKSSNSLDQDTVNSWTSTSKGLPGLERYFHRMTLPSTVTSSILDNHCYPYIC